MKLEGSLDAFSLPDIFQLLSFTKKSGGLHLAHDGADGVVYFSDGQVTGASADGARQPLARRLVGAGAVDDEALRSAVTAASDGENVGVARALLDHGALDGARLQQAATDQAVDAVFDLLRWERGDFVFVVDEVNPDDVGVALAADTVLGDAEARRETWEQVRSVVPSSQAVLSMPVVLASDPQVSREEWSLLALVDGRRTAGDLVDLTGSGQYAVVSTLAGLVSRGLLEVRDAGEDADGGGTDHVSVVLRRQALLAPLESTPFTPVVTPAEPEVTADAADESDGDTRDDVAEHAGAGDGAVEIAVPLKEAVADGAGEQPGRDSGDDDAARELASAGAAEMLGGAHVPGDVVPPRPEPFLPKRQAEFDDTSAPVAAARSVPVGDGPQSGGAGSNGVVGATAVALDPEVAAVIERDPSVNRSLMLRLIAGVRGL